MTELNQQNQNINDNQFANMTNEEIIDMFLEDILFSTGLNEAPENDKKEFKARLKEELEARVGIVVMNAIPEEKAQEFVDLMKDNPTSEVINDFISKNVPNLETLVVNAMKEFKEEFLREFEKNLQEQINENQNNSTNENEQ